mmetsp:Transcript_2258/g.6059  ORF Transcript_2258/g.6059 Transcript_2258/m.6059 type:complete len:317 (-) Transcript_2258:2445-3395(-)
MGKKSESAASKLVLQSLAGCSQTKKELKRMIKAKSPSLKSKYTKRALKNLVTGGKIRKNGKEYRLVVERESSSETESSTSIASKPKSILLSEKEMDASAVPIGMKLRKPKKKKEVKFSEELEAPPSGGDIDDEIARLERELMGNGGESDDSQSSSDEEESELETDNNNETGVLSLSEYANDRVEGLASTCLPVPGKYSLAKRRKEDRKQSQPPAEKSGLQKAVEEVLGGYTARSSEKIPFYCRFCSKQYENEEAFHAHKSTEFHKTAVAVERKATFCKLCRKQFTSPIQMKEHLSSRPHKQRLQNARSRQQKQRFR